METKKVDPIEHFIEKLVDPAHYGLYGEKPLAVIAALKHIQNLQPSPTLRASLTELITSPIPASSIKRKFMTLANQTGKLKDPDASWGNIVKELPSILRRNKSVDESFRTLTRERVDEIIERYLKKLEAEKKS